MNIDKHTSYCKHFNKIQSIKWTKMFDIREELKHYDVTVNHLI